MKNSQFKSPSNQIPNDFRQTKDCENLQKKLKFPKRADFSKSTRAIGFLLFFLLGAHLKKLHLETL